MRRGFRARLRRALSAASVSLIAALVGAAPPARAELQVHLYGGLNGNFSSRADLDKDPLHDSRDVDWKGKPLEAPPYWGARATWWLDQAPHLGIAVDFTHTKAYADVPFRTDPVYNHLEFTDGNNLLTANLLYRFTGGDRLVPYIGAGLGLAIPHVEVILDAYPQAPTWNYQLAGFAGQLLTGLEYRITDAWSLFAEGKLSYSRIDAGLAGGGSIRTELWSPQLALGISWRLWRPAEPVK